MFYVCFYMCFVYINTIYCISAKLHISHLFVQDAVDYLSKENLQYI